MRPGPCGFRPPRTPRQIEGVVLLALLLGLALVGISLLAAVDIWSVTRQRERERELLHVGAQYRQAIRSYYFGAPAGTPRVLPPNFAALLEDDRYPIAVRHLRRAYPDPITGKAEWGTLRVSDRIIGVFSFSEARPMRQAGFLQPYLHFNDAPRYRDWVFSFSIPGSRLAPLAPAAGPSVGSPPSTSSTPVRRNPV